MTRASFVLGSKSDKCIVQHKHFDELRPALSFDLDRRDEVEGIRLSLAFLRCARSCIIDEDLAHYPRCDGEQVHLIRKARRAFFGKLEIRLVHQGCRLQRMIRPLSAEMPGSDSAQVSI